MIIYINIYKYNLNDNSLLKVFINVKYFLIIYKYLNKNLEKSNPNCFEKSMF